MSESIKYIKIRKLPIRLGQFMKLANLVQDGIEAKIRIQSGEAMVNEETEIRRGRQLIEGDRITLENVTAIVVKDD